MSKTIDSKEYTYESIAKLVRNLPFKDQLSENMQYQSLEDLTIFLYQKK